jgi:GT2 family glycosyltransferase
VGKEQWSSAVLFHLTGPIYLMTMPITLNPAIIVDVVVNTKNRDGDLGRCVASLRAQRGAIARIIIVDNGHSTVAEKLADRLVRSDATRLSALFNLGWRATSSDIIGFLADDAEAEPQWLESIIHDLSRYPQAAAVSGPVISMGPIAGEMHRLHLLGESRWWLRPFTRLYENFVLEGKLFEPGHLCESGAYTLGAALERSRHLPGPRDIDLLTTTSMGVRRHVLEALNGFDEEFHFNHADGDFFVRAKQAGHKLLFDPQVVAHHHVRLGPSRAPFHIGRDTARFLRLRIHPKSWRGWVGFWVNIGVLNLYWLWTAINLRSRLPLEGIRGFAQGWRGNKRQSR